MLNRKERNMKDPNAQAFYLVGGDHAVLLLHGFTGSPGHMRPFGEALHRGGYTVFGICLPGHGTQFSDMRVCTAATYIEAVRSAVFLLKEQYKHVSVAGLSMGGVLSLIAAQQTPLTSVIALSTPIKTPNKLMPFAKIASPFKPVMYWPENDARDKLLDQAYDYGYSAFPTGAAYQLHRLITLARKNLFAITCPLLVVQSRTDNAVSSDGLDMIMNRVSSKDKGVLWLDTAPHVVTLSSDLPQIADAALSFLGEAESKK